MNKNKSFYVIAISMLMLAITACTQGEQKEKDQQSRKLDDAQIENIVQRSYQYVAMYNVTHKFALNPGSGALFMDGFNKPVAATELADHNVKSIARPNSDTLYQGAVLDLRHEPMIIKYPVIDSKFVVLQTSGYDHYTGVP